MTIRDIYYVVNSLRGAILRFKCWKHETIFRIIEKNIEISLFKNPAEVKSNFINYFLDNFSDSVFILSPPPKELFL